MNDETLEDSHPNPWLYAGVLEEMYWTWPRTEFERWDHKTEYVNPGDTLLVLRTAIDIRPKAIQVEARAWFDRAGEWAA